VTAREFARRLGPPLLLSLVLVGLGAPALRQYNVTWDEALGDFFFGQRYGSYFTSFDARYLDFDANPYPPGFTPDLSSSLESYWPSHYYPVGGVLGAATSELLFRRLGWLDPYDGYHAANLWLAVIFVFVFHAFLRRRFGGLAAVLAPVLLFLSPRIVCDLMANIKDFPSLVFFSITLVAFLRAFEAGSFAGVLGAGVLWGLALGAKSNALFVAPIVGLLLLAGGPPPPWRGFTRALLAIAGAGVVGVATWILVWPNTWDDPPRLLWEHLRFLAERGAMLRPESVAPPFPNLLYTTPIPFLVLFALGLWPLARRVRRRERAALLVALWIAVVWGRLFLPGAVNFDGVRHFLELFPPLAVVAALGAAWLVEQIGRIGALPLRRGLQAAAVALPVVAMAVTLARTHPFEIAYWNALVGGLAGADERRLAQAGDYWGTSYRLGLDWLNENAAEGAALAVPVVEHAVRLVAPERLRRDIALLSLPRSAGPRERAAAVAWLREQARTREVYVMFVLRRDWMTGLMRHFLAHERPVRTWDLDGVPVLRIYRMRSGDVL
jgi:MFS family permease